MAGEQGPYVYALDQLVVDLQHLEVVDAMLNDLQVRHDPPDMAPELGLALLGGLKDANGNLVEVDGLAALLRQWAAAERDGWVPVIGKNRQVDAVIGEAGHKPMIHALGHKPMDGAEPDPADPAEIPPAHLPSPHAGEGVRIGMVDTPLLPPVPRIDGDGIPFRAGHGGFVADLIKRQAPGAELYVEGTLDDEHASADSWDVARAMLRLVDEHDIHVLNLSLGCYTAAGGPPLVMARAVERVADRALVVAAAGNHGALTHLVGDRTSRSASWPGGIAPVVAVGAVDATWDRPAWSPNQPWVTCVALGVNVVAAYLKGEVDLPGGSKHFDGHARWSGTSFAAATVTGAVAARTVPGSVSPREALAALLEEKELVRPFRDPS